MFVGHMAVGLAVKRAEPRVPLAVWVVAAFGLDVLWPVLLLAGRETVTISPGITAFTPLDFTSYPWSHSLVGSVFWAVLVGAVGARRWGTRAAAWLGAVVLSHWGLDLVTHRPDLPLWPRGPLFGLGLWQSLPATFIVEGALWAVGIALYVAAHPARDRTGTWSFVALMLLVGLMWASGPFSPPPPSVGVLAMMGLLIGPVLAGWTAWIEAHRD
jgi:membrane-bound metal-dependent hydrolase YbcI (DUF457 family)